MHFSASCPTCHPLDLSALLGCGRGFKGGLRAAKFHHLAAFFLITIRTIASKTYRYQLGPAFDFQTFYSTKIFDIIDDDSSPQGPCMSSNHEIWISIKLFIDAIKTTILAGHTFTIGHEVIGCLQT
ncbi:MAG: hypothetical protein RJB45_573 [Pseudomonadota bacterium]|jgi:hypothetical protein